MTKTNPFRFSTKWWDDETGLGNWGRRYYDPDEGKWISRDPIGEDGGVNLYAGLRNDLVSLVDPLGERNEPPSIGIQLPTSNGPNLSKRTIIGPNIGKCGMFDWTISWGLTYVKAGIIVQSVLFIADVKDCKGAPVPVSSPPQYWEGWTVSSSGEVSAGNADTFAVKSERPCTKGSISIIGFAEFYPRTMPSSMRRNPFLLVKHPAGDLPYTETNPNLTGGTGPITHTAVATWDCCPNHNDTQLTTN